jgi:hypothetical protein
MLNEQAIAREGEERVAIYQELAFRAASTKNLPLLRLFIRDNATIHRELYEPMIHRLRSQFRTLIDDYKAQFIEDKLMPYCQDDQADHSNYVAQIREKITIDLAEKQQSFPDIYKRNERCLPDDVRKRVVLSADHPVLVDKISANFIKWLTREFEALKVKADESLEDYIDRITAIQRLIKAQGDEAMDYETGYCTQAMGAYSEEEKKANDKLLEAQEALFLELCQQEGMPPELEKDFEFYQEHIVSSRRGESKAVDEQLAKNRQAFFNYFIVAINTRDEAGNTLLHYSVRNEDVEMVRFLVYQDGIESLQNSEEKTPLMIAQERRYQAIISQLEECSSMLHITEEETVTSQSSEGTLAIFESKEAEEDLIQKQLIRVVVDAIHNKDSETLEALIDNSNLLLGVEKGLRIKIGQHLLEQYRDRLWQIATQTLDNVINKLFRIGEGLIYEDTIISRFDQFCKKGEAQRAIKAALRVYLRNRKALLDIESSEDEEAHIQAAFDEFEEICDFKKERLKEDFSYEFNQRIRSKTRQQSRARGIDGRELVKVERTEVGEAICKIQTDCLQEHQEAQRYLISMLVQMQKEKAELQERQKQLCEDREEKAGALMRSAKMDKFISEFRLSTADIEKLIKRTVDPNARDPETKELIVHLAFQHFEGLVPYLIDCGANPKLPNKKGATLISLALTASENRELPELVMKSIVEQHKEQKYDGRFPARLQGELDKLKAGRAALDGYGLILAKRENPTNFIEKLAILFRGQRRNKVSRIADFEMLLQAYDLAVQQINPSEYYERSQYILRKAPRQQFSF